MFLLAFSCGLKVYQKLCIITEASPSDEAGSWEASLVEERSQGKMTVQGPWSGRGSRLSLAPVAASLWGCSWDWVIFP